MLKTAGVAVMALILVGCTSGGAVATVDGVVFEDAVLNVLSPENRDAEGRASDVYLLVLHHILTTRAAEEFVFVASEADVAQHLERRTAGAGDDLEARLANRDTTLQRVQLEAELDAVRAHLEAVLVQSDEYGFDLDDAYRSFLGVNSRVCLRALGVLDATATAEIEKAVDGGADIDELLEQFPAQTTVTDLGCLAPVDHGPVLAPVALDGEIGVAYVRKSEEGSTFVAEVIERDAPPLGDVREEVVSLGAERQGPALFDAWAVDAMKAAKVEIRPSIGTWQAAEGTDGVPTVVPG